MLLPFPLLYVKVLDFLFLVGKVEEEKYTGDSAETALIASKEDANKVC